MQTDLTRGGGQGGGLDSAERGGGWLPVSRTAGRGKGCGSCPLATSCLDEMLYGGVRGGMASCSGVPVIKTSHVRWVVGGLSCCWGLRRINT